MDEDGRLREGYIKLWRKITEKPDWPGNEGRSFTKFEARIDMMLMLASGTTQGSIERGSFEASLSFLAKRWLWSKGKARHFLNDLEAREELRLAKPETERAAKHEKTQMSVCKYDHFNPIAEPENEPENEPETKPIKRKTVNERRNEKRGSARATDLTEHWNSFQSLTTHHSENILRRTERGISARMDEDGLTLDELKEAVRVFAQVRENREKYWSPPWDLPDFLSRSSGKWVRAAIDPAWQEYFRRFAKSSNGEAPEWLVGKMQRAIGMAQDSLIGAHEVTDEDFLRLVRSRCCDLRITFTQELYEEAMKIEDDRRKQP